MLHQVQKDDEMGGSLIFRHPSTIIYPKSHIFYSNITMLTKKTQISTIRNLCLVLLMCVGRVNQAYGLKFCVEFSTIFLNSLFRAIINLFI